MTSAEKNLVLAALRILQEHDAEHVANMREEIGGEDESNLEAVDVGSLIQRINFGDEDPGRLRMNGGYLVDDCGLFDQGLDIDDEAGTTVEIESICAVITFAGSAYLITDGGRVVRAEKDDNDEYLTSTAVGIVAGDEVPADVAMLAKMYHAVDEGDTAIFYGPSIA